MKLRKRLIVIFDRTLDIMAFFAGVLLLFAVASVGVGIVMRSLGNPLGWVFEVSSYILLYVTFLVAAWTLRLEGHVHIDIVINQLKPRTQSVFHIITSAIGVLIALALTWYGAKVTYDFLLSGHFTPSVLEPPKWIFLIIIPIGSLALAIQFIRRTYHHIKLFGTSVEKAEKIIAEHEI